MSNQHPQEGSEQCSQGDKKLASSQGPLLPAWRLYYHNLSIAALELDSVHSCASPTGKWLTAAGPVLPKETSIFARAGAHFV